MTGGEAAAPARRRRLLAAAAASVLCCVAPGVLPATPATASCAGPQHLQVEPVLLPGAAFPGGAPTPSSVLAAAGEIEVSGVGFAEGCDDTGGGLGCEGPPPVVPMRGVDLVLEQDGATWTLGTADAAGGEGYAIGWRVRFPQGVAGPAVLRARTAAAEVLIGG
ncbi:hypothetical protein [Kineococcus glutinatus]|uniref:Uncharacterized protein n=1 Tax=Kineococcus glutinatus TaxID=1070872 RepID=A0ABP9H9W3_9ACTN